ncbi:MAG: DUF3737 family protein [Clostridiales bacterium]|nr:DUF3737 family protein [Clostridiales bacterium]
MKNIVENVTLDGERALYGSKDLLIKNVKFDGPADGESAVKECENIEAENCFCNLRYPFWHVHGLKITGTEMTEFCRAALWYSDSILIKNSKLHGIKALRECADADISDCDIISPEFGWSVKGIKMRDCTAVSEYFMMRSENIDFKNVTFKGKYSFQYIKNATFENCNFDTKDAFWHGENITVKDSVIKGEYFAWYSHNLTLINCTVIGTQPFCYCTGLKLVNCRMEGCDLAFEKSEAEAEITTRVDSIKNPYKGTITVAAVGEIIRDDPASTGKIVIKN